ncbi:hypothetical protein GOP47_0017857 [Adiantum capillus-veneris]|uniref:Uncharacterized protein n=1 Tax=Adiantum capillus-veneris TaxID=13818 RepID=A0A9D4ZA33_ADICA|nr:hypothetical protein GOP47_0017857 [Adiantum capillus-veneris]
MLRVLRATAARTSRASLSFFSTRNPSGAAILPALTAVAERAPHAHSIPGDSSSFLRNFSSSSSSQQRQDGNAPSASGPSCSLTPEAKLDSVPEVPGSVIPETHDHEHDETLMTEQLTGASECEALSASCSASMYVEEEDLHTKPDEDFDEELEFRENADPPMSAGQGNEAVSASDYAHTDADEHEEDLSVEASKDSTSDFVAESEEDCAIDMSKVPEDLKEMLEDSYVCESADEDFPSEGPIELLTLDEVKQVLEEVRAKDVIVFPVHDRCEWTDVMVVATGISDRHVRGIADALVYKIKKKGIVESPLYPTIEGQFGGKWLVVDCGNIVIHALDEESRAYYRLEDLWTGEIRPSTADEDFETMLNIAGLKEVET